MKSKYLALKRRAKEKNRLVTLTYDQFREIKTDNCYYCGVSSSLLRFYCEVMDINTPWITLDRKDNLGDYTPDNVVSACFLCNKIKGSFFTAEEMTKIGREFVAPKMEKFKDEAWDNFEKSCEYLDYSEED